MNKITSIIFLIFVCLFSVHAKGSREDRIVEIIKTYSGMASFGYDVAGEGEIGSTAPLVIKNKEDYERFIVMIPEYKMTRITPAPPSDDPLLKKPPVDFTNHMMLVIFSHDWDMFISLKIEKVEISGGKMIVTTWYEKPNPEAIVAKIIDYGFYYAVVVNRFDGEIVFE